MIFTGPCLSLLILLPLASLSQVWCHPSPREGKASEAAGLPPVQTVLGEGQHLSWKSIIKTTIIMYTVKRASQQLTCTGTANVGNGVGLARLLHDDRFSAVSTVTSTVGATSIVTSVALA